MGATNIQGLGARLAALPKDSPLWASIDNFGSTVINGGGQAPAAQPASQPAATQPAQNDDAAVLSRLQRLAGNPERDVTPQAKQAQNLLNRVNIAKNMDGYKNEYTGKTFSLKNMMAGMPDYLDAMENYGNALIPQAHYSAKQKAGSDMVAQELDNALRRPPKMGFGRMLGPLAVMAMTGGIGALAAPAMGAGFASTALTGANIAKNALGLVPTLARKG